MKLITKSSILIFLTLLAGNYAYAELRILSTGIGEDQRQELHADYSLKLVFFVHTGAFLANIDVEISTPSGKQLLKTSSYGPWLFVDLESGMYKVSASRKNGDRQSALFSVLKGEQKTISLMFQDN